MGNTRKGGMDHPHKKAIIRVGASQKELPDLSMQCFEQRHGECPGRYHSPICVRVHECECECHPKQAVHGGSKDD